MKDRFEAVRLGDTCEFEQHADRHRIRNLKIFDVDNQRAKATGMPYDEVFHRLNRCSCSRAIDDRATSADSNGVGSGFVIYGKRMSRHATTIGFDGRRIEERSIILG